MDTNVVRGNMIKVHGIHLQSVILGLLQRSYWSGRASVVLDYNSCREHCSHTLAVTVTHFWSSVPGCEVRA